LSKYRRDRNAVANHTSIGQILIVEDDVVTRTVLRRILEKPGWAVVATDNGRAALQQLDVARPHRLLDLMLPYMDGFELSGELRKSYSVDPIPIVVTIAKDLTPSGKPAAQRLCRSGATEILGLEPRP
jgi:CheY-like chemotaxis protein